MRKFFAHGSEPQSQCGTNFRGSILDLPQVFVLIPTYFIAPVTLKRLFASRFVDNTRPRNSFLHGRTRY